MPDNQDVIVDIPPNRIKFFGRAGKMLLPSPATVATTLKRIASDRLVNHDILCQDLCRQFKVEAVCPVTTRKALKTLAQSGDDANGWWRVLSKSGDVLAGFPEGGAAQIRLLDAAGYRLKPLGKAPRAKDAATRLSTEKNRKR